MKFNYENFNDLNELETENVKFLIYEIVCNTYDYWNTSQDITLYIKIFSPIELMKNSINIKLDDYDNS